MDQYIRSYFSDNNIYKLKMVYLIIPINFIYMRLKIYRNYYSYIILNVKNSK
ncbi:hypothetical protein CSC2_38940 [Clostridium zeae]|uniref:Uncharacterized protein n=1 Tax=Clostridium zeae TaxID=2759022 RepID=A0ABQ1EEX0_9CLOT|nr:hypothetical protein CSC2_38940 [Clostridium zeae]